VPDALSTLRPLWGTKGRQRVSGPRSQAEKGPPGAGKCDVPGIFVNDPAGVWNLPDTIVTEVRPPPVPVTPPPRKSDIARPGDAFPTEASRPGLLMGVTACQDPHEEPRTISDGRQPPGPPPQSTPSR